MNFLKNYVNENKNVLPFIKSFLCRYKEKNLLVINVRNLAGIYYWCYIACVEDPTLFLSQSCNSV